MKNKCIFCDDDFDEGGCEHVFLSALGGRLITRSAICTVCNNKFAREDKIDDSLAESFVIPRCALMIWSGRDSPPPSIKNAGKLKDGTTDYDLAPGFLPIIKRAQVPTPITTKESLELNARDTEDAKRVIEIMNSRGEQVEITRMRRIQEQVAPANLNMSFNNSLALRCIAKTALTTACVLYGNQLTREKSNIELRASVEKGNPSIYEFAGWDFSNPWPSELKFLPFKKNGFEVSGVEHSVYICDVQTNWVAYVTLFGHFRFSVRLGSSSGLSPKGIGVNPRSNSKSKRAIMEAKPPMHYKCKHPSSLQEEHCLIQNNIKSALYKIMSINECEAKEKIFIDFADDLSQSIDLCTNKQEITEAIDNWSRRFATIYYGGKWEESLDSVEILGET